MDGIRLPTPKPRFLGLESLNPEVQVFGVSPAGLPLLGPLSPCYTQYGTANTRRSPSNFANPELLEFGAENSELAGSGPNQMANLLTPFPQYMTQHGSSNVDLGTILTVLNPPTTLPSSLEPVWAEPQYRSRRKRRPRNLRCKKCHRNCTRLDNLKRHILRKHPMEDLLSTIIDFDKADLRTLDVSNPLQIANPPVFELNGRG
ncbi:hypothetical protein ABW19_dt0208726 [Dactylella cylindrospora]|nr:hypothetical protein ABW19_dt0208726 [Dactylella cylindrospora]